jgi:hypothetical protein
VLNGVFLAWWQGSSLAPGGEFGDVLVDGGAADAEQPGDGGDGVVRPGQQVAGVTDLLGGHGRGPTEARAAGAGGVQSLAADLTDAYLAGWDLDRGELPRADFANATLTGAKWPTAEPVPEGWELADPGWRIKVRGRYPW